MNKIILHGKLGKDPEISYAQSGNAICKFTMATDNGKDKDPTWHNVVAFKKTAEVIAEHFSKGKEILIEGKQEHNKYEDKDGKTNYFASVACFTFEFCGSKGDQAQPQSDNPFDKKDDSSVPF